MIRGEVVGETIRACEFVEVAPPITSAVPARPVDATRGIRDKVLAIPLGARDELVGTLPPVAEKEKPLAVAPSGPKPIFVLNIGHSKSRPGAQASLSGMKASESIFNTELASMIAAKPR